MDVFPFIPSSVLVWLVESTIFISILICLIFAVKAITRCRLPAWWHYGLWLLLVARMLMPGLLESRLSIFSLVPDLGVDRTYMVEPAGSDSQDAAIGDLGLTGENAEGRSESLARDHLWWDMPADQALLLTWLIGILIFCLVVLVKNLRFWMLIRQKRPMIDGDIMSLLRECKQLMSVKRDVSVVMTHGVTSPALFGYLKPRLLLPENALDRTDRDQLHYIFLHELGHIRRHDIAVSCLMTLLQAIHWFNPFVWYAFYCMRADMETACDAHVLSRVKSDRSAGYAHTIIGILERFCHNRPLPALVGIVENRAQMKRRITMIMGFKKHSPRMTPLAVLLLIAVGIIAFTGAAGLSAESEKAASEDSELDVFTLDPIVITPLDARTAPRRDEELGISWVYIYQQPLAISAVFPSLPIAGMGEDATGWVDLKYYVNTKGNVIKPSVVSSEPEGLFDEAALEAIMKWRFQPAIWYGTLFDVGVDATWRFEKGRAYQQPRVISKADPPYPIAAVQDRIQGHVTLRYVVTKEGKVTDASVVESEPEGAFDEAVLRTVPGWYFQPYVINDKMVDVIIMSTFRFELGEHFSALE